MLNSNTRFLSYCLSLRTLSHNKYVRNKLATKLVILKSTQYQA